jgi:EmrB/QacA subfamily drug resistance transporter
MRGATCWTCAAASIPSTDKHRMQSVEGAAPPLDDAAKRSFIIGIMLAMLVAALDQTIVATALPTIGRELGDAELLPWVVTIYLLTSTATAPLYGKISDIYGRRPTLLACLAAFLVSSVLCALAPTMLALVAGRMLQGIGGGGLMVLAQSAIADVVPPRERGRYQAYIASVFVMSSTAGPLLGGFLADHWHWSIIFWLNVPLCLGAMWTTNRVLKQIRQEIRPHRLDFLGGALMMVATSLVLLALNWGGHRFAWSSPVILSLFAAAAAVTILLVRHLRRVPEPLLPLDMLQNRVLRGTSMIGVCCFGTFIGLTIFLPFYIESVHRLSPSLSGLVLLAMLGGGVFGATISGRMISRTGRYRPTPLVGVPVSAVALGGLALGMGDGSVWMLLPWLMVAGIGIGTTFSSLLIATQNAVERRDIGIATATFSFARSLGGAFVVAAYGAILFSGLGGDAFVGESAGAGTASTAAVAGVYRHVFLLAALTLAAAVPILWRLEERPLGK